jgi:hypothetical protein
VKIALNLKKGPKMSKLVRYKVSFHVLVDENDPGTPEWILESICENLEPGEDVENFDLELIG